MTGDNGLLNKTKEAQEKNKISEEKDKVKLVQNTDVISNNGKNNTKEGLQKEFDKTMDKTKVTRIGKDSYIVTFLESNRNYKIEYGEEVKGPVEIEMIEDSYAGDISKGNILDGSKEKPYEINCIEDLVDFSNKFENDDVGEKEIILTRDLDFLSELSYQNYQTTKYGDINNDGKTSGLMEELTTGTGFKGINIFRGTFDGQNKKISNLYINYREATVGFFKEIKNATIKNLTVNGEILGGQERGVVGGIIARGDDKCVLYNLEFRGMISGYDTNQKEIMVGGILGEIYVRGDIEVNKCRNKGNITASGTVGGIIGRSWCKTKITNCYNTGNLTVKSNKSTFLGSVGGIIGALSVDGGSVENCYNTGKIINEVKGTYNSSGGIVGTTGNYNNIIIANCYNIGETKAQPETASGGIQGSYWYGQYKTNMINCYYDGSKSDRSVYKTKEEYATKLTTNQMQGKEKIVNQDGTSSTLVELLNKGVDNNTTGVDTNNWFRWKQGENRYPIFE